MNTSIKIIILFLFFGSGVSSLIYEVVWIRMFGIVLGNTTYAISIILGAFFGGLALGGFCSGRYIDNLTSSSFFQKGKPQSYDKRGVVRIYAYLELGIAASAIFVGVGVSWIQELFIWLTHYIDYSSIIFDMARFFFSFLLLLIPTTFMGATLPVLSKFIIRRSEKIRGDIGSLYGINTFGAMLGCFITGFYLIETFGVSITVYIAIIINSIIGIAVLLLARSGLFNISASEEEIRSGVGDRGSGIRNNDPRPPIPDPRPLLFTFGLSGFTSIAYEIIWTRMLSSIFMNSIYSFTSMLGTFLCGLAIGAILTARVFKGGKSSLKLLGIIEFLIGISAILLILLFKCLPDVSSRFLPVNNNITWIKNVYVEVSLAFMVMIVPCILIGMTMPLISRVITKDMKYLGRSIGDIYSINTLGGILGALIVGCLLIPMAGLKGSELIIASLNIFIGVIFYFHAFKDDASKQVRMLYSRKIVIPTFCVSAVVIGGFCSILDVRIWDRNGKLLYYNEDSTATVSVVEEKDGNRKLVVNNKYTLGTTKAAPLQERMGYVPLLLHNNPAKALVIGMGTGITLGAVESYELTKSVTCVEVIPSVTYAARRFFSSENKRIFQDTKTNIIIDDGRNYIMLNNEERYDVIISDLFVPYHAGAGSLYTKEHFELCRERLFEDGLFCQWLPLYQMSEKEFKIICQTFKSVFPFTTLWFCSFERGLICGLMGTKQKLKIDPYQLQKRIHAPSLKNRLRQAFLGGAEDLLSLYVTDEKGLTAFTQGCGINTDDFPIIEFLAPKNIYEHEHPGINNLSIVAALRDGVFPLLISKNDNPANINGLNGITAKDKEIPVENKLVSAADFDIKDMKYYSSAVGRIISALLYFYDNKLTEAEDEFLIGWELAPEHLYLRKLFQDLSVTFYRMAEYDETIFINEKLVNIDSSFIDPYLYFYLGLAFQAKGNLEQAVSAYNHAINLNAPNDVSIHYNLGSIYKSQGLLQKAIEEFKEVIRLDPNEKLGHDTLAATYLEAEK